MTDSPTPSCSQSDPPFAVHYLPDWHRKGSCLADHVDTWTEQSDKLKIKEEEHSRGQSGVRERRESWMNIESQSEDVDRRDTNQIGTAERKESWSRGKINASGKGKNYPRRGSYDSEAGESFRKSDFLVKTKDHIRGLSEGVEVCHTRTRCHSEPLTSHGHYEDVSIPSTSHLHSHSGRHGHYSDAPITSHRRSHSGSHYEEPIPTTSHLHSHQGSHRYYENEPVPSTSYQRSHSGSHGHYEEPIPATSHQRSYRESHGHYDDVPIPSTSCQHQRSHQGGHGLYEDVPNPAPLATDVVWEWQDYEEQDWWGVTGQGGSPASSCHNLSHQDDDMFSLASLSRRTLHHDEDHGQEDHHESWEDLGCATLRRAFSSLTLRLHHAEKERPVQRILRQPRRRQTTRGLSGLPIEAANQWTATTALDG